MSLFNLIKQFENIAWIKGKNNKLVESLFKILINTQLNRVFIRK